MKRSELDFSEPDSIEDAVDQISKLEEFIDEVETRVNKAKHDLDITKIDELHMINEVYDRLDRLSTDLY